MIEVQGLVKRFGAVTALDQASFAAADGQITGLLGMNGAGKSTALRILSTVLQADGGVARVAGIDIAGKPLEVRRRIRSAAARRRAVRQSQCAGEHRLPRGFAGFARSG